MRERHVGVKSCRSQQPFEGFGGLSSTQLASMSDSNALDKWHDFEQGLVLFFCVSNADHFPISKKVFL